MTKMGDQRIPYPTLNGGLPDVQKLHEIMMCDVVFSALGSVH